MYHIEYQNYCEDLSNGFLRSYRLNVSDKLDELAKGHILSFSPFSTFVIFQVLLRFQKINQVQNKGADFT